MPNDTVNYTCPHCGGPLYFDPESQKLACGHCGSTYTQEEVRKYFAEKEQEAAKAEPYSLTGEEYTEEEARNLQAYSCPSCGARIYTDKNTAVTICPYCGSPSVIESQFAAKKPDYVLPFQLSRDQAVQSLKEYCRKKPFLPKAFLDESRLEKIQGVYVPFWLFSATMDADASYEGIRERTYMRGDDQITEIRHYRLTRSGTEDFQNVPVDASARMPDEYMDALEPFDTGRMQAFHASYMVGYMADSYDTGSEESARRADERMTSSILSDLYATTAGFQSVTPLAQRCRRTRASAAYTFYPVWMLTASYRGKSYLFAVNGQSGKVVGKLPADNGKFVLSIFAWHWILFAILALIAYLAVGKELLS